MSIWDNPWLTLNFSSEIQSNNHLPRPTCSCHRLEATLQRMSLLTTRATRPTSRAPNLRSTPTSTQGRTPTRCWGRSSRRKWRKTGPVSSTPALTTWGSWIRGVTRLSRVSKPIFRCRPASKLGVGHRRPYHLRGARLRCLRLPAGVPIRLKSTG